MNITEFWTKYCGLCGSQRCFGEEINISTCGYYNGDIEGIPKLRTDMPKKEEKE